MPSAAARKSGDRYQRGGGNVAKAIAEECALGSASAIDVKSFCAAPVHAIVVAAALIEAGIEERVVVVAGGSLGKLGMKFEGALAKGFPVLEDLLAGIAVLLEPADGSNGPIVPADAVGRMPIEAGVPQAQLEALVGSPSMRSIGIADVGTYARRRSTIPRSPSPRAAATSPIATTRCSPASVSQRRAREGRHRGVRARPRTAGLLADQGTSRARCHGFLML